MAAAFKMFDKDGSGQIQATEIKAALDPHNKLISMKTIELMIAQADEDKDGQISFDEFVTMMKKFAS